MAAKVVGVTTDHAGSASLEVRLYAVLHAVAIRRGTLGTPDVEVVDRLTGTTIIRCAGVDSDRVWYPRAVAVDDEAQPIEGAYDRHAITGVLQIRISDGGATKAGEIVLIYE